jgi:hypothetical protein
MTSATRQLRLIQAVCVVLAFGCILAVYLTGSTEKRPASTEIHAAIVVLGAWSAVGGFTFQRKLLKKPSQRAAKSSAFTRWRVGHIWRLWSAVSVVVCGVLLWEQGGSRVAANALFAVGVLLLLIWSPGVAPAEDQPTRSAPAR